MHSVRAALPCNTNTSVTTSDNDIVVASSGQIFPPCSDISHTEGKREPDGVPVTDALGPFPPVPVVKCRPTKSDVNDGPKVGQRSLRASELRREAASVLLVGLFCGALTQRDFSSCRVCVPTKPQHPAGEVFAVRPALKQAPRTSSFV